MLLDFGLLLRHLPLVSALLLGMLLVKTAVVVLVAEPVTHSWFKSIRTGVVIAQGGEFGFALLTLVLRNELLDPGIVQPLLRRPCSAWCSRPCSSATTAASRACCCARPGRATRRRYARPRRRSPWRSAITSSSAASAGSDRTSPASSNRRASNTSRWISTRTASAPAARPATPSSSATRARPRSCRIVGLAHASCVVITFANPTVSLRILRAVRDLRGDVPVLVRTQDDNRLLELQAAGATEVVPETFEASLMLLSHLLLLLKVPVSGVIRTVNDIRGHRYGMLRQIFRAEGAEFLDENHAFREELHSVILPPHAWAVGRSVAELGHRGSKAAVSAVRRDGIVGREPAPDTVFKVGDVVVVCGTPEAVEHAETLLLMG